MKLTILEDAAKRPEYFSWAGAIEPPVLDSWLAERGWNVPDDLKYFWSKTGGGDFFESETIFAPFSDLWAHDSIDEVNRHQINRGIPKHYLPLHDGLRFSAVNLNTQKYMFLDENNYQVQEEFPSLEAWYVEGIRPEFVERYSLAG
ncbi:MAG TPA: SMI1/KNR4 family protein [Candidatus Limnocylindrales bacterium]|nr:SMI1/KNR4 family protein [Candidatus Limnocylindrales bacterium]